MLRLPFVMHRRPAAAYHGNMRKSLLPLLFIGAITVRAQSSLGDATAATGSSPLMATVPPVLKKGDAAPAFSRPDEQGRTQALKALLARGPVLLAFYPKDFTGGCTAELSELRDQYTKFTAAHVTVLAVSADDAESHRKFREKYKFPFPILVDGDRSLIAAYGQLKSMERDGGTMAYANRSFFLIGRDGKLAFVDQNFKIDAAGWQALFAAVAALPAK